MHNMRAPSFRDLVVATRDSSQAENLGEQSRHMMSVLNLMLVSLNLEDMLHTSSYTIVLNIYTCIWNQKHEICQIKISTPCAPGKPGKPGKPDRGFKKKEPLRTPCSQASGKRDIWKKLDGLETASVTRTCPFWSHYHICCFKPRDFLVSMITGIRIKSVGAILPTE